MLMSIRQILLRMASISVVSVRKYMPCQRLKPRLSYFIQSKNFFLALLLCGSATVPTVQAATFLPNSFKCGGELEASVWHQWSATGKEYLEKQLIGRRLLEQGDSYALYDIETFYHNLLAMAQRCQRIERQLEMADAVRSTYVRLEQVPAGVGRAWLCRGGAVCNQKNRLINSEVMLTSVQFLAFAIDIANSLERSATPTQSDAFADETARITVEHMQRWGSLPARSMLRTRIIAKPSDVKSGSSALFFTDKDIWQIAIYADLAGILVFRAELRETLNLNKEKIGALGEHLTLLLKLFKLRTTLTNEINTEGKSVIVADLDRGFWRLYADNQYASYNGLAPPVSCKVRPGDPNQKKLNKNVDASSLQPSETLGWDISHARRLVHFFNAIERNRSALMTVFGLSSKDLPSQETIASFARQLTLNVWDQNKDYPLFTNYFNGVNGWYRVAYDNGTGRCTEGYKPYGLSNSFPSGGYASWAAWNSDIDILSRRLYMLTKSNVDNDKFFIKKYYSEFSDNVKSDVRQRYQMMFWPTLIK